MRSPGSPTTTLAIVCAAALIAIATATFVLSRPDVEAAEHPKWVKADRVILISLDTLRQDHMSLYGYPRPTTPNLEALAAKATVFTNAMSQAPYTLPSHMTMMTGMHPLSHNVRYHKDMLAEEYQTLAERMKSNGYTTAGFTDGGFLEKRHGFAQGFDTYEDDRPPAGGGVETNGFRRRGKQLQDWIYQHQHEPFFLFFHTFDCHAPYVVDEAAKLALASTKPVVPARARAMADPIAYLRKLRIHDYMKLDRYQTIDQLVDDYDATIRFTDQKLGELLAALETLKLFDSSLIIITSDHGESFLDHGMYVGHGLTLYEEEIRVPLIVKFPGGRFAGKRVDDVVRLMDLYPTVCGACAIDCPIQVEGLDLEDAVTGKDAEPRIALGESPNFANHNLEGPDAITSYARRENLKYVDGCKIGIQNLMDGHMNKVEPDEGFYDLEHDPLGMKTQVVLTPQVYDLAQDPAEQVNLVVVHKDLVDRIQARLTKQWDTALAIRETFTHGAKPGEVEDTIEKLEQLLQQGYIGAAEFQRRMEVLRMRALQNELDRKEREKQAENDASKR